MREEVLSKARTPQAASIPPPSTTSTALRLRPTVAVNAAVPAPDIVASNGSKVHGKEMCASCEKLAARFKDTFLACIRGSRKV